MNNDALLDGLAIFQNWIMELRRNGLAFNNASLILDIDESIARRFCIGIAEDRLFFGVQEGEIGWFGAIPWLHLAVKVGTKNISFVTEEIVFGDSLIPPFALTMKTDSREKAQMLTRMHYLDIRKVRVDQETGFVSQISKNIITTLDVVSVEDDRSMEGLIAGRDPRGRNRSVIRSIEKGGI